MDEFVDAADGGEVGEEWTVDLADCNDKDDAAGAALVSPDTARAPADAVNCRCSLAAACLAIAEAQAAQHGARLCGTR